MRGFTRSIVSMLLLTMSAIAAATGPVLAENAVTINCNVREGATDPQIANNAGRLVRFNISTDSIRNSLKIMEYLRLNCTQIIPSIRLSGTINKDMADIFDAIYSDLTRDPVYMQLFVYVMEWIELYIVSSGGDIEAAMRIGRRVRELNAWVHAYQDCSSSCVFVLAAGAVRHPGDKIGIHRPYFSRIPASSSRQAVAAEVSRQRQLVEQYFAEMGQPRSLVDAMYAVPPERMRILSSRELESFNLSGTDAAYDEITTAGVAWMIGISSAELRRRRALAERICRQSPATGSDTEWFRCRQEIEYATTSETLEARRQKIRRECEPIRVGRDRFSSIAQLERYLTCARDILSGAR